MKIEVIAIGSEILSGYTVNSNASYISMQLTKRGIETHYHTTLPDIEEKLVQAFNRAFERSDIIIATGGLGPTCDDLTRDVVAKLLDSPLVHRKEIEEMLVSRYGEKAVSLRDQATLPDKAIALENSLGTASGLYFYEKGRHLFLLPGVPSEMKEIFNRSLLPRIEHLVPQNERFLNESLHFTTIFESKVDPLLRELKKQFPKIKVGIYPFRGLISVQLSHPFEKGAEEKLKRCKELLLDEFGDFSYPSSSGAIEEAVKSLFIEKQLTLTTAESCSGGAIAARLTALPGASNFFSGGVVTYSNEMKKRLLDVSENTLLNHGAVSREVVVEMAEGALQLAGSDASIAISGIAGPTGGSSEKPVGTVWLAIAGKEIETKEWLLKCGLKSRQMIIDYSVNRALGELYHLFKTFP